MKVVYLMRGVPASGKSYAARRLAGKHGLVCETDSFFGPPGEHYHFKISQREEARNRNMQGFMKALHQGFSPIVVDRGNGKGRRTRWYAQTALLFGYTIKLAEPTSPWWKTIRRMLARGEWPVGWVDKLYQKQKETHRVSRRAILSSVTNFDPRLTVKEILNG